MSANEKLAGKLNHLLANLVVEYHKLQNLHWYVKGPDFFQAHAKLEEYYDEINGTIDEIAEVLLQIGGQPLASLGAVLSQASLKERADGFVASEEAFATVLADYEALLAEVKDVKATADEFDCALVSAQMDGYIAAFSKAVWLLRQRAL